MIEHKKRHSRLFKTIAIGVVCLFLANQLAWAYPYDTLATPAGDDFEAMHREMHRRLPKGSPGNAFDVIYTYFRTGEHTVKEMREHPEVKTSEVVADRDCNMLFAAGLITKRGQGDDAVIETTLSNVKNEVLDRILRGLIPLGARTTNSQVQEVTREAIQSFGGHMEEVGRMRRQILLRVVLPEKHYYAGEVPQRETLGFKYMDAERQQIIDLIDEAGDGVLTITEIVQKTGMTYGQVQMRLTTMGMMSRVKRKPRRQQTQEQIESQKALAELINKPCDYNWKEHERELPDLEGKSLGVTNTHGRITFAAQTNYPHYIAFKGAIGAGWEAAVKKVTVSENIYEFVVELKRGDESLEKTMQIGNCVRQVPGAGKQTGKTIEVLDIDEELGLQALGDIVTDPKRLQWQIMMNKVPDLKGMRLGTTNDKGRVSFAPIPNYNFYWYVYGDANEEWDAVIEESGVMHELFQFTVLLTRGDQEVRRTFQISPHFTRQLKGKAEKDPEKEVLEIDDRLGTHALAALVTKPTTFNWNEEADNLPNLAGFQLGETNTAGAIGFAPVKYFPFHLRALGVSEEGWKAVIINSGVENGHYNVTVRFTRAKTRVIVRRLQIGRFTKTLLGRDVEAGNTMDALDVDTELGKKALSELATMPEGHDFTKEQQKVQELIGLHLGKTNKLGALPFTPMEFYPYKWYLVGHRQEGWTATIVAAQITKYGYPQFTVQFSKHRYGTWTKTYIISPIQKRLSGTYDASGTSISVHKIICLGDLYNLADIRGQGPEVSVHDKRIERRDPVEQVGDAYEDSVVSELSERIDQLLKTLPPNEREIAELIVDGGYDTDIAAEGGYPLALVGGVRQKLQQVARGFMGEDAQLGSIEKGLARYSVANQFRIICEHFRTGIHTVQALHEKTKEPDGRGLEVATLERGLHLLSSARLVSITGHGATAQFEVTLGELTEEMVQVIYDALAAIRPSPNNQEVRAAAWSIVPIEKLVPQRTVFAQYKQRVETTHTEHMARKSSLIAEKGGIIVPRERFSGPDPEKEDYLKRLLEELPHEIGEREEIYIGDIVIAPMKIALELAKEPGRVILLNDQETAPPECRAQRLVLKNDDFLYLEGAIALARAIYHKDTEAIKAFYDLLAVSEDRDPDEFIKQGLEQGTWRITLPAVERELIERIDDLDREAYLFLRAA